MFEVCSSPFVDEWHIALVDHLVEEVVGVSQQELASVSDRVVDFLADGVDERQLVEVHADFLYAEYNPFHLLHFFDGVVQHRHQLLLFHNGLNVLLLAPFADILGMFDEGGRGIGKVRGFCVHHFQFPEEKHCRILALILQVVRLYSPPSAYLVELLSDVIQLRDARGLQLL